jgi:hypothetical protein
MSSDGVNHQLPSSMVAREFGEVNVRRKGGQLEVNFTVLMEPTGDLAEGWQTGVALDASASMKSAFGRGLRGNVPPQAAAEYQRKGWLQERDLDGRRVQSFLPQAYQDAIAKGYLIQTTNLVEPLARQFISYLADNLDEDGGTTVIYWACDDGSGYEVAGDFTGEQVRSLAFSGPQQRDFGSGTRLLPAMRYFVDRFRDARRGMYLFLTDGRIDDLGAVKGYTTQLCQDIARRKRNMVKCVLLGVGDKIDEGQMEELDDLESGTDVDIWDHKIAGEMRGVVEIFAEVVDENQIVAPTARILDASDRVVKSFADGLPAKVSFTMPATSQWFELEVGGERIRQSVVSR